MKHTSYKQRGFTLIEVLVAATIFATSLSALLLMVGTGFGNVTVAKNKTVANYLAQEGLEIVRYDRDYFVQTDPINGWADFSTFLTGCDTQNSCGVSALHPLANPIQCVSNDNCHVVEDTAAGGTDAYGLLGDNTGWPTTMFHRYFYIETTSADWYVIHSVVTWTEGTGTYTSSMSETVYNWY